jgi:hypothetical protein
MSKPASQPLIAAIADVYDAVTSDRAYKARLAPQIAMQRMYEWTKEMAFHPVYAQKFIQRLGVYPVGTVVWLDTGEIGVVMQPNPASVLRPRVRLMVAKNGQPLDSPIDVDLTKRAPTGAGTFERSVASAIEDDDVGVDVNSVLRFAPIQEAC